MSKYIDADALDEIMQNAIVEVTKITENNYGKITVGQVMVMNDMKNIISQKACKIPAADVEPVRHGLIEQVKKYAADMEKMYTEVCADFRERTGQDYVCGACKYNDCAYVGADGDWCGECPGFESDECFVLSNDVKGDIWKIVNIVNGAKTDGGRVLMSE